MHYINMLNPYSFYHLWHFKYGKNFIIKMINSVINESDVYELLDFFNTDFNSVRSYCIFEGDNNIVLVDFNLNGRMINDDLGIINFLKISTTKNIYLIMLNDFKGINTSKNNIYNLFKNDNILFADTITKQFNIDKKLAELLYSMNDDLFKLYLHENILLNSLD